MDRASAPQLWQAVLGELQLQVTGPIFATYLRDTVGARFDGRNFTVAAPSDFVLQQLSGKLRPLLTHTLTGVAGGPVELAFEVLGAPSPPPPPPSRRERGSQTDDGSVAVGSTDLLNIGSAAVVAGQAHLTTNSPSSSSSPLREQGNYMGQGRTASLSPSPAAAGEGAGGWGGGLRLNDKYVFPTFIVGTSNRLAHAAAQGVAENPGYSYNPLFLYGGVGLGKTHLLQAIGHVAAAKAMQLLYVSAEQFTNEFVNSIRERRGDEFRAKYRNVDVLLIDDIQFIAGKEQTQEEFFHTFNDLHAQHHQIVITSDRSPKLITLLEDRLRSRFEWGLQADIQPPDYETRLAILRAKAEEGHTRVPEAVLEIIAQRVQDNIRELEGSLNRVLAFANLTGVEVTIGLASQALADLVPAPRRRVLAPEEVIDAVADYYSLPPQQLASKARDKHLVHARHVAMYLLRSDAARPLTEIGRLLGKRDHTTVMHGTEKIEQAMYTDPQLRQELSEIRTRLGRG
ncbi:MAG: chromosomal replication initiator protein DnaA [Chloroflexi bacterium]|nr:chromosomal replication initiator protein DnaA [Chloroflexota bacterium]